MSGSVTIEGSPLYQRDNALDETKMPPLAKNMVDETAMAVLRQWIASPLEVLSVYLYQDTSHLAVRFNSHVDPATAVVASNYMLVAPDVPVSQAVMSSEPDTVILTVPPLTPNQTYFLSTSNVQDTAPSANTIWLQSQTEFLAQEMPPVTGSRLANISTRLQVGLGDDVLIAGFIARGASPKRVMLRAIGPSLGAARNPQSAHGSGPRIIRSNWSLDRNQRQLGRPIPTNRRLSTPASRRRRPMNRLSWRGCPPTIMASLTPPFSGARETPREWACSKFTISTRDWVRGS